MGDYNISKKRNINQNVVCKNSHFPNYDNRNPDAGEYEIEEPNLKVETIDQKYRIPKTEGKSFWSK